jgi:predicted DNA-binding protein (MmcQ/YjbR family)
LFVKQHDWQMNVEEFREYCLMKSGVTEGLPFDESTLVFKVMGKMFALTSLDAAFRFTVKAEPERGQQLKDAYSAIEPAWHMNKTHWIMVTVDKSMDDNLLKEIIDQSYDIVSASLTKKQKEELNSIKSK